MSNVSNIANLAGGLPEIDPARTALPDYRDGVNLRDPGNGSDPAVGKDTFLKLLVAQIRNQDPMSPADGMQFVTQLAQFTELEQMIAMRQDMSAVRQDIDQTVGAAREAEKP